MALGGTNKSSSLAVITNETITRKSAAATLTSLEKKVYVTGGTGGFTITLCNAAECANETVVVQLASITSGTVTVAAPTGDPSGISVPMTVAEDTLVAWSDGERWHQFVAVSGGSNDDIKVTFTVVAGASNVATVKMALTRNGVDLLAPRCMTVWLSDDAEGEGLTGTTASGAVASAGATSGVDLGVLTTKKAILVTTNDEGYYTLSITDTAKTTFYVCCQPFGSSKAWINTALVTASYGA